MKTFYVYIDWTQEEIPRPFYVGKGNFQRVSSLCRNQKHSWVAKQYGQRREIVLETIDEKVAFDHEIMLIWMLDTYNSDVKDYSDIRCNRTFGGDGTSGFEFCVQSRTLMSERKRGTKRRPHSAETRRKIREGNLKSSKTYRKFGTDNPFYGKSFSHTDIAKAKISKSLMSSVVQMTDDCDFVASFDSRNAASKATGICYGAISDCCRHKRENANGFRWEYLHQRRT